MKKPKNLKRAIIIVILAILIVAAGIYLMMGRNSKDYVFETAKLSKGDISNTVTATGTLEATNTVVVGTQVSGVIKKIYVDFNSEVVKGQLLAELDKSTLQFSLDNAEADVANAQAEYDYQQTSYYRMTELFNKDLLSASDHDLASFNFKRSQAGLKSAKANLSRAEKNLSYAMIYSPIKGVVQNRAVDEGQTVAASMSTPELFTIANDLSSMQVQAYIDEADIGQIKTGQKVTFSVDSFQDETFEGKISEVRLQPRNSSNVVTYPVIIEVANPELKLKPGLTASITIYVEEVKDVLLVPAEAINFSPDKDLLSRYRSAHNQSQANSSGQDLDSSHSLVWVKDGDKVYSTVIETGIEGSAYIQVISGLAEYSEVLTSFAYTTVIKSDNGSKETKSPFLQESKGGPGGGTAGPPPGGNGGGPGN